MVKPLSIGLTSYINSYPFWIPLRQGPWHIVRAVPKVLNALLRQGELDIALISPLEYARGGYHFLKPFGIGALEAIYSVNLYVHDGDSPLVRRDEESTTSVRLLEVLAGHYWHKELRWAEEAPNHLLIGDKALQPYRGGEVIDLAKAWWEHTHRGFVFALLATPQATWESKRGEIETFCAALRQGLLWSLSHLEKVVAEIDGFDGTFMQKYLTTCRYLLGEKELQGLELFLKYV